MPSAGRPLVLLAADWPSTNIVYHALSRRFGGVVVLLEDKVPRLQYLRRRVRRLGLVTVTGQVLFMALVRPVLERTARARVAEILETEGLDVSPIDVPVIRVPSANSSEAHEHLQRLGSPVVVVNGTRILSERTLSCVPGPFINMHSGITPRYRGVHGGYWALVEGRTGEVGTTVHLIDLGLDTGPILGQATFSVSEKDSFVTYPYLHLAAGLPILLDVVEEALAGRPLSGATKAPEDDASTLRSHPTLWGYLGRRLSRSVA